jgi:hypothetical protein
MNSPTSEKGRVPPFAAATPQEDTKVTPRYELGQEYPDYLRSNGEYVNYEPSDQLEFAFIERLSDTARLSSTPIAERRVL